MDRADLLTEIDFIAAEVARLKRQAKNLRPDGTGTFKTKDGHITSWLMHKTRLINDIIKIRRDLNELRQELEKGLQA